MVIYPVLLSGGAGSRLWPLSRKALPKQFHALLHERSLLQETALRFLDSAFAPPTIVANEVQRFIVAEHLRQIEITPQAILLEAVGRNTAPAAASAALYLQKLDPQAVMVILPTDHSIADVPAFGASIKQAGEATADVDIVALGMPAREPEEGFGYIQRGSPLPGREECFAIAQFVEKPDAATAEGFVRTGDYLWNCGVFVCRIDRYLEALARRHPAIVAACTRALDNAQSDLDFLRLDAKAYEDCPAISIDYAIMEEMESAAVVTIDVGWNDVGSWASLWDHGEKTTAGNVVHGDVVVLDAQNSYIRSEGPLVAVLAVQDVVVVASDDAVLICDRRRSQEVRDVVSKLETMGRAEAGSHRRAWRPWGYYESLQIGDGYQIKQLMVEPGAALSLQRHRHRAEHWVVVQGTALVRRGEEEMRLETNQSTFIPVGELHRLENPGPGPLRVIEVQTGDYLGEDDIERLEDRYGRRS